MAVRKLISGNVRDKDRRDGGNSRRRQATGGVQGPSVEGLSDSEYQDLLNNPELGAAQRAQVTLGLQRSLGNRYVQKAVHGVSPAPRGRGRGASPEPLVRVEPREGLAEATVARLPRDPEQRRAVLWGCLLNLRGVSYHLGQALAALPAANPDYSAALGWVDQAADAVTAAYTAYDERDELGGLLSELFNWVHELKNMLETLATPGGRARDEIVRRVGLAHSRAEEFEGNLTPAGRSAWRTPGDAPRLAQWHSGATARFAQALALTRRGNYGGALTAHVQPAVVYLQSTTVPRDLGVRRRWRTALHWAQTAESTLIALARPGQARDRAVELIEFARMQIPRGISGLERAGARPEQRGEPVVFGQERGR